ncbi:exosortase A [Massilia eurypsychrophila]|uniref:Exosortase A n=2 Tax=Massilia eurypsychrophila TaxID=1485217 RepID=A0A2G8TM38_9BURK|nr:exosortase A [Massilia eurypsychrophila]
MTRYLIIAVALLLPLLIHYATASSIVSIWNRSETFAHGYIIVPISLWLAWERRATLVQMTASPFWPGFVLLALCGFGWLLADLGDVQIVKQYAFAAMLPLTALAVLGRRISRVLAFSLLFLLFAVPFGEVFIDPLINITANFTIDLLRATGIPVLREGNNFSIPSGNWSVVEACSGLRYLIASVTLGTLYAHLTYRSRWRQALFILLAIIVPIVANTGRAYMIVMMGHLSGMTMAVGVDHLIYGWVFFGIVMFVLFWIGTFWREDRQPAKSAPRVLPPQGPPASTAKLAAAALAVAVCIGAFPLYAAWLEHNAVNPAAPQLSAPQAAWQVTAPFAEWTPGFAKPAAQFQAFYANGGQAAGLSLLYYRGQRLGTRLISSTNHLVTAKSSWRSHATAVRTETVGARVLGLREEVLSDRRGKVLFWHWYRIDGKDTRSDYIGKAYQVAQKALHGSDDGAAIIVYARFDEDPEHARATLRAFLAANLAPVEAALDQTRRR